MCWHAFSIVHSLYLDSKIPLREQTPTMEAVPPPDSHLQPEPPTKHQKHLRRPPGFWDNLSQVPLCRGALREFDRRTVRPIATHKPLVRSALKEDLVKQLKRYARHGGPDLRDIRGVGRVYDNSMLWRITLIPFLVLSRTRSNFESCFQNEFWSFSPKPRSIRKGN
jgi:hypothetical protein